MAADTARLYATGERDHSTMLRMGMVSLTRGDVDAEAPHRNYTKTNLFTLYLYVFCLKGDNSHTRRAGTMQPSIVPTVPNEMPQTRVRSS